MVSRSISNIVTAVTVSLVIPPGFVGLKGFY